MLMMSTRSALDAPVIHIMKKERFTSPKMCSDLLRRMDLLNMAPDILGSVIFDLSGPDDWK